MNLVLRMLPTPNIRFNAKIKVCITSHEIGHIYGGIIQFQTNRKSRAFSIQANKLKNLKSLSLQLQIYILEASFQNKDHAMEDYKSYLDLNTNQSLDTIDNEYQFKLNRDIIGLRNLIYSSFGLGISSFDQTILRYNILL